LILLAPVILNVPANDTVSCASEIIDPGQFGVRAIDSCEVSLVFKREVTDSTCINKKKILNIWTARDSCFHVTIDTQVVVVNDTIPPQILNVRRDTTVFCTPDAFFDGVAAPPFATDNCDSVAFSITIKTIDSTCINNKKILSIYTAVDACGNTAIDTFAITILDTLPPVILNVPQNDTVECVSSVIEAPQIIPAVIAIDSCEVSLSFRREVKDSTCINHKTILNIWTARDSCFHVTIDTQIVVVNDTIPPQINNVANDTTVFCTVDALIGTLPVIATDNCDSVAFSIIVKTIDSTCINNKKILNIFTAIDACGNTAIDTFAITVLDTLPPVILNVPANDTVECASSVIEAPEISPAVIAVNSCEVSLSFRREVIDSTCINHKTILNIWTARDSCFHVAIDTQVVVVNDTIPPIILGVPANDTVDCLKNVPPFFPMIGVDENCSDYTLTFERKVEDSLCANKKKILNIWTAVDTCGNMAIDTQVIVINDTIPPIIPNPGNVDTIECGRIYDLLFPIASDNCDEFVLIHSDFSTKDSTCPGNYTTLIIYTASDSCGNTSVLRDSIIHIDTTAPLMKCPLGTDTIEVACGILVPGPYTSLDSFLYYGGIIDEACCLDSSSFSFSDVFSQSGPMFIYTRRYRITDCCGLTDSCIEVFRTPSCYLDLALKKEIDGMQPFIVLAGGVVPFKITVYNQYLVAADSIKITDYLPSVGSSVTTPGWVNNGNGTACITLARSNGLLPPTGLEGGDSVVIQFNVQLGLDIIGNTEYNEAEITSAADTFHNHLNDVDSDPDAIQGNDPTVDNEVNQTPPIDEDDDDIAQFFICGKVTFSCVDHINASLDENCQKCFTATDCLQSNLMPDELFIIELYDPAGNKLPSNCVGREWLGYTLTYKVVSKSPCVVNICWGTVTIEDKYPPFIDTTIDTITCFDIAKLPKNKYKVADNCSDSAVVTIASESYIDYGCDSPLIQGLVTRQLIASDPWGNQTTAIKKYYILKINLDSVICPRDTMIDCRLEIVGGVHIKDVSRSGVPTVKVKAE
jgi:hypothetical protein